MSLHVKLILVQQKSGKSYLFLAQFRISSRHCVFLFLIASNYEIATASLDLWFQLTNNLLANQSKCFLYFPARILRKVIKKNTFKKHNVFLWIQYFGTNYLVECWREFFHIFRSKNCFLLDFAYSNTVRSNFVIFNKNKNWILRDFVFSLKSKKTIRVIDALCKEHIDSNTKCAMICADRRIRVETGIQTAIAL